MACEETAAANARPKESSPDDPPPDGGVEEKDGEDAEAMVTIKGTKDAAGERIRFDRKNVMLAYASVAFGAGLDAVPPFGFGASSPAGAIRKAGGQRFVHASPQRPAPAALRPRLRTCRQSSTLNLRRSF